MEEHYIDLLKILLMILNIILVLYGLYLVKHHFKVMRTTSYIERFNTKEMSISKSEARKFISLLKENENNIDVFLSTFRNSKDTNEQEENIDRLIDFFTEIGAMYELRVVDDTILYYFRTIIPRYYEGLEVYIKYCQKIAKSENRVIWDKADTIYKTIKLKYE